MELLLNPEINFCSCGCEARLIKKNKGNQKSGKKRFDYWVECLDDGCSNKGKIEAQSWKAILNWNSSDKSDFPDYIEIPFLSLIGLNQAEIEGKITGLECELNNKADKTYKSGRPLPQKAYIELKAKIAWLEYAKIWFQDHFGCTGNFSSCSQDQQSDNPNDEFASQTS